LGTNHACQGKKEGNPEAIIKSNKMATTWEKGGREGLRPKSIERTASCGGEGGKKGSHKEQMAVGVQHQVE